MASRPAPGGQRLRASAGHDLAVSAAESPRRAAFCALRSWATDYINRTSPIDLDDLNKPGLVICVRS